MSAAANQTKKNRRQHYETQNFQLRNLTSVSEGNKIMKNNEREKKTRQSKKKRNSVYGASSRTTKEHVTSTATRHIKNAKISGPTKQQKIHFYNRKLGS